MTDETTGAPSTGAPTGDGLTDAEKLTALQAYMKALKPIEEALRAAVTADMGMRRVERVGAFLPDGEKLGTVGYRPGNKVARVIDPAAALAWCLKKNPDAVVQVVNPWLLKKLIDYSAAVGEVDGPGIDPVDGEALDFIAVRQGNPFVSVCPTKEGVARMARLAAGYAGMLEPERTAAAPEQETPVEVLHDLSSVHVRAARAPWDETPSPWDED